MPKARTNIQYGNDDGTVTTINAGEEVTGIPPETLDELIAAGAVEEAEEAEEAAPPAKAAPKAEAKAEAEG